MKRVIGVLIMDKKEFYVKEQQKFNNQCAKNFEKILNGKNIDTELKEQLKKIEHYWNKFYKEAYSNHKSKLDEKNFLNKIQDIKNG